MLASNIRVSDLGWFCCYIQAGARSPGSKTTGYGRSNRSWVWGVKGAGQPSDSVWIPDFDLSSALEGGYFLFFWGKGPS